MTVKDTKIYNQIIGEEVPVTNKVSAKTYLDIMWEAAKIATISLGFSYIFFLGLVKADIMYEQTQSDIWAIVIIGMLCAVACSIIIGSGVYLCIFKEKKRATSLKLTNILIFSDVIYVGLMLVVFPALYRIHESNISGSEWGSDLLLAIIQGCVIIVACIWIVILGISFMYERSKMKKTP